MGFTHHNRAQVAGKWTNLNKWYCFCIWYSNHQMEQRQDFELYPFYVKASIVLVGLIAAVFILYVLSPVIVPLAFAVLITILLNRLYVQLEKRMPKVLAILATILIAILLLAGLFYFLSTQIAGFMQSLPLLK